MLRVANALTSMNMESAVDASLGWKRLRDVHIGLPSSGGQLCVILWYHRGCYCAVLGDIYMLSFENRIVLHTLTCLKDVDMSGCSPTSKQPSNLDTYLSS